MHLLILCVQVQLLANRLLGLEDEKALLKETSEQMQDLGLEVSTDEEPMTEEEEIDTKTPQIFGGRKKKKDDLH